MSKEKNKKLKVLLSAGGTGGHMTPAQGLCSDLISRGYDVELVTDPRGLQFAPLFGDIPVHQLPSGTLGAGIFGKVKGLSNLALGCIKAFALLRKVSPDIVAGFGGYPSVPAVYAAQKWRIPTVIHEQNAIIGKANLFLAPKAERIALSLPYITGLDEVDQLRTIVTGNPVRSEISDLYNKPYPVVEDGETMRVLVMGGSLGAKVFSDVVPQTLARLPAEYRGRLYVVQQCRSEYLDGVKKAYADAGIEAELAPFFDDVPSELAQAHLVIGRSGASTVAEVSVAGRPAIFVPYPHHKDQQQKMNADSVADQGGAWVMSESGFTQDALLAKMETFFQDPQILFKVAENSRSCGKPDAARRLGNLITALAQGWN